MAKREIGYGHYVTSADGTLYTVSYVGEEAADLRPEDGGDMVTLPLSELRRVANPYRKRVPIDGLPDGEWPRCQYCGRKLEAHTRDSYTQPPARFRVIKRVFEGWKGYQYADPLNRKVPLFDRLVCAARFAGAAYRGGHRLSKPVTQGRGLVG